MFSASFDLFAPALAQRRLFPLVSLRFKGTDLKSKGVALLWQIFLVTGVASMQSFCSSV